MVVEEVLSGSTRSRRCTSRHASRHETTLKHLFEARQRLCAAAWLVVRDAPAAEDLFQNVALKSVTKNVSFEHEGALLS